LLARALTRAVVELIEPYRRDLPEQLGDFGPEIEAFLTEREYELDERFLEHPRDLPIVADFQHAFEHWLKFVDMRGHVASTIAALSLKKSFSHVPSLERFWDSSACTARVSGWLAQQLKGAPRVRPDDAYTFGLFRDCGVPVLMIPFPEYQGVLRKANDERELAFTAIEDQMLSINHAIVGSELAEEWLLPEEIHHAIRHHHETAPEASRRLIAVSQAAEYLIQRHTGRNQTNEWHKLGETCLSLLGLGQEDLDRLCDGCHAAVSGDAA